MLGKTLTLLASPVLAVLLVCGVALAANITCPTGGNGLCVGTPQDDTMTGTDAGDRMFGRNGADTMRGGYFQDAIAGEGGNDTIYGEGGRGNLYGDSLPLDTPTAGDDFIIGGPVHDEIHGGPGSDKIRGNPGRDYIYGDGGNDRVWGGPGSDQFEATIWGDPPDLEDGYDIVHGGDGLDRMMGAYGERYGEGGPDYLSVYGAKAIIRGGVGDDHLTLGTYISNDRRAYTQVAYGGPGEDDFGVSFVTHRVPDEFIYQANDGEHDFIRCYDKKKETVRADPLDTFPRYTDPEGAFESGREHCDSLTIVE